jgi:hypothetical protein
MTEVQIQDLMKSAAMRGHAFSHYQAAVYLSARELLARDPSNQVAQTVVEDFSRYLIDGTAITSFDQFLLPIPETDEDKAEFEKQHSPQSKTTIGRFVLGEPDWQRLSHSLKAVSLVHREVKD